VGDRVQIVDSAETTAKTVKAAIGDAPGVANPVHHFLVTDATERFRKVAGEFLDHDVGNLELVTLE
jgi:glutamate racemase